MNTTQYFLNPELVAGMCVLMIECSALVVAFAFACYLKFSGKLD